MGIGIGADGYFSFFGFPAAQIIKSWRIKLLLPPNIPLPKFLESKKAADLFRLSTVEGVHLFATLE